MGQWITEHRGPILIVMSLLILLAVIDDDVRNVHLVNTQIRQALEQRRETRELIDKVFENQKGIIKEQQLVREELRKHNAKVGNQKR